MNVRRVLATALVCAAAAAGLVGCGSDEASEPNASTSSSKLANVEVSGGGATKPTVTLKEKPLTITQGETRVVKEGSGEEVNDQAKAMVRYLIVHGATGKEMDARWEGKEPAALDVSDKQLNPTVVASLKGQKVGAQVLAAVIASEVLGPQGDPSKGVKPEDAVIYLFEVFGTKKKLTQATGTPVTPPAGLPTVDFPSDITKPASFSVPEGYKPPTSTVVQPLIKGAGPAVKNGDQVTVMYTGVTVRNPSEPFDYSQNRQPGTFPFVVGKGNVIKAWDKAVVGQPVGSRILIVAPPSEAYGKAGSPPKIQGGDTLLFVVDILDTATP